MVKDFIKLFESFLTKEDKLDFLNLIIEEANDDGLSIKFSKSFGSSFLNDKFSDGTENICLEIDIKNGIRGYGGKQFSDKEITEYIGNLLEAIQSSDIEIKTVKIYIDTEWPTCTVMAYTDNTIGEIGRMVESKKAVVVKFIIDL